MKNTIYFLGLLFLGACNQQSPTASDTIAFFDLKDYFEQEIQRLSANKTPIKKTIVLGGKEETQTIALADFEKELVVFKDSDINKAAWWDKYVVDTTFEAGKIRQIHYKTQNTSLRTKEVSILFEQDVVTQISIHNQSKTTLAASEQQLDYQAQKGYTIQNKQAIRWSSDPEQVLSLEAHFLH